MAKKLIPRFVVDVKAYSPGLWVLKARGFRLLQHSRDPFMRKELAIEYGIALCQDMLEDLGLPCQLVIHKKNGKIQSERTYGKDPPEKKG